MKEREEAGSALPSALATAIMDALEGKPSAPTLTLLAGLRPEGMPTAPTSLGVVPKAPFPKDPRDPRPRGRSKLAVELGDALQKALDGYATVSAVPSSKRMVERIRLVTPPPPPARPVQKDPAAWRSECLVRGVCAWCERPVPPGDIRCALHKRRRTL